MGRAGLASHRRHLQASASWAAGWGSSSSERSSPAGKAKRAAGQTPRAHAHRQGDRPCRALLAPRRRGVDRGGTRRRERQGAGDARACGDAGRQDHGRRQAPAASAETRGCGAITSRAASSPATRTRKGARRCSRRCRQACRASSRWGGSTSTPRACSCSPPTARWRGISNCRAPAGSGATGCGRMAASTQDALDRLRQGVTIDGVQYGPVEARIDREQGSNLWLTISLREGKNREVKRIAEHLGLDRQPADPRLVRAVRARRSRRRRGRGGEAARARRSARREARRGIRTGRAGETAPPARRHAEAEPCGS